MVNLNEDMQLTGRIRHHFPEGKVVKIGQIGEDIDDNSSDEDNMQEARMESEKSMPDVVLAGANVWADHATIAHIQNRCILRSSGRAADFTFVNGVPYTAILSKQQKRASTFVETDDVDDPAESSVVQGPELNPSCVVLQHEDRVAFGQGGQCLYLFVDPQKGQAELIIMGNRVTYSMARSELANNKWKSAGLKFKRALRKSKDILDPSLKLGSLIERIEKRISMDVPGDKNPYDNAKHMETIEPDQTMDVDDSSTGDDCSDSVKFDRDSLKEMIQCKERELEDLDKIICDRNKEIKDLQRLRNLREAETAQARADAKRMEAQLAQSEALLGGNNSVRKLQREMSRGTEESEMADSDSSETEGSPTTRSSQTRQSQDGLEDCQFPGAVATKTNKSKSKEGLRRNSRDMLYGKSVGRHLGPAAVEEGKELSQQQKSLSASVSQSEIMKSFQEAIECIESVERLCNAENR